MNNNYFVVQLVSHTEPDMEKFQADKTKLTGEMSEQKAAEVVSAWEARRCDEARDSISFDPQYAEYHEMAGTRPPRSTLTYVPMRDARTPATSMNIGGAPDPDGVGKLRCFTRMRPDRRFASGPRCQTENAAGDANVTALRLYAPGAKRLHVLSRDLRPFPSTTW